MEKRELVRTCPNCKHEHYPYQHRPDGFWDGETYRCSFCKHIWKPDGQTKLF